MADIKTMKEKDWNMHFVMISLPTNVVKQVTIVTINPEQDVLGTLEVVEQQMRQLNNTKFPLSPERGAKKKKTRTRHRGGETEEEVGAIKGVVGEVGGLEATPGEVDNPVFTLTTQTWDVLDVVGAIIETNVRRCPQSAPALTVIQPAMWTRSA